MSSVRRKRKTLSNVLTQMDTRLRSAELKQIKTGAGTAIEATSLTPTETSIGTVVSDNAPSDWIKVVGGAYYSKRVTGETDRVELYLQADTGAYTDNTLTVSGINTPYDVSGDFIVTAVTPTGDDRPSWMNSIPSGVTSTIVYTTGQDIPESAAVSVVGRYQVESYSATTTHATVVFTANHGFAVGDVISTSELDSPFDGLDGIFRITGVTADSITYAFDAEIVDDIASTTPGSTVYVYAVTQKKTAAGDTWIDTSTTPSTTYYWNGLRWSLSRSAATEGTQDTLAPANVTDISSTSSAYTIDGGIARARVTLSWVAPTKNSDDTDLTDLAGYEVWANYTGFSGPWTEKTGVLSASTSTVLSNLNQNVTVYFKIFAIDSSLNRSEGTEYSTTTSIYALELNPPSAPILSTRNGVVTAQWNGLDNTGVNPPLTIRTIEVHAASSSSAFTPSSSTLKGTMPAGSGNYFHIVDLTYGSSWYVKFVAVDVNANKTAGSTAATTNVNKVSNVDITAASIEADRIKSGFMEALLVQGETIRASSTTLPNAMIEFNSSYFRAVNTSNQETFKIDVSNGVTTIGASTVISGNSITTGTINAAAVSVTNLSANAITTGTLNAGNITVTNLSASAITTGTLNAANITVQNLSATSITTGTLSGSRLYGETISGVTISGGTLITSGLRHVEASGSSFKFFDNDGNQSGYIGAGDDGSASTVTISNGGYVGGGATSIDLYNGGIDLNAGGASITVGQSGNTAIAMQASQGVTIQSAAIFDSTVRIATGADSSNSSSGHAFQIGSSTGINLRIDNNEIIAVNNGSYGTLYLNQSGPIHSLWAYSNDITTTRHAMWISSAGQFGWASSSRRKKQDITSADIDIQAVLSIEPKVFRYIKEVERVGDEAPLEIGMIAEDLHDAGLNLFVDYGATGEQPEGIHYERYAVAIQAVVRHQAQQIQELQERLSALESK
jgi:hypothetical protein